MFYLYCAVLVALFIIGYECVMTRLEDEGVNVDRDLPPNYSLETHEENDEDCDIVGVLLFVPKVVDEPPKPDLREQYRIWVENARLVNEDYQRRHSIQTQGSA